MLRIRSYLIRPQRICGVRLQQSSRIGKVARMAEISLAVTRGVLNYTTGPHEKERQIAYTSPTPDIAPRLAAVWARDQLLLRLGGRITLVVADRGAIWRAHNAQYVEDFDALFAFLARRPSEPMRFLWEIVG